MITTSPGKGDDAARSAPHDVIISTDAEQMAAAATRFDFILNTIPVSHEIDPYLQLLGRTGHGDRRRDRADARRFMRPAFRGTARSAVRPDRRPPETQEMLDFCAARHLS